MSAVHHMARARTTRTARRRWKASDRALMQQVLSAHHGEIRKGALFAQHGEINFRLRFDYSDSREHRARYMLSTTCPHAGRFRITAAGRADRRFRDTFPKLPFTTGDAEFDDAFVVQTRDLDMARTVLGQKHVRDTIRAFFAEGAVSLHVDGERVKLQGRRVALGDAPERTHIVSLVERLDVIGQAVARVAEGGVAPAPRYDAALVLAWSTTALLVLGGGAACVYGTTRFDALEGVRWFLPSGILFAALLVVVPILLTLLVSRRTAPHRLLAVLLAPMLFGLLFTSLGAVINVNGMFDDGPAEVRVLPVLEVTRHAAKSTTYRAWVSAWWREGRYARRIGRSTYERLAAEGGRIQITTRPGALDIPWVQSALVLPPGDD